MKFKQINKYEQKRCIGTETCPARKISIKGKRTFDPGIK